MGSLAELFEPRSIAMIGASSDPRKISGRPIQFLKTSGFGGAVYPVNPQRSEVQGIAAYRSLADVPGPVDLAIIGLPATGVDDAVSSCIDKGVKSIVLFSAGFAETGPAGLGAQDRLVARCRSAGIRLLGPNCLGLASFRSGAYATFSHSMEFAPPVAGAIAMVSQSGAVGTYALVKGVRRGLRFSRFVATGNEADIDVADCIAWLADDPETEVIIGYMESCRDGRRLAGALERARSAGKPVALLKGGTSAAGSEAAASHTGALAGADAVYDAAFAATGTARATSIDELLDIAYAASQPVLPKGPRLGVITVSGGFGVMMADAAADTDIVLPPVSANAQAKIREVLPFAATTNPVDMTPQMLNDFGVLPPVLSALFQDDAFDSIAFFFGSMGLDPHVNARIADVILESRRAFPDRLFAACMMTTPDVRAALEAGGVCVFEDPERLVRAVARLAGFRKSFANATATALSARIGGAAPLRAGLSEATAKAVLADAGIPFAPERVARSADEAALAAGTIGNPVALKIVSADIAHKTEVGGVVLNVPREAASTAYAALIDRVRTAAPAAKIDGVSVAPMIAGGIETILGTVNDPDFGPVVVFGLGGVFVETVADVALRLAPVDEAEAEAMIRSIKGFPVLTGARGTEPADLDTLARSISALSRFAAQHAFDVASIDINPFIALPRGGCAVDALIVPRTPDPASQAIRETRQA
jgi:acyl-CoA synthetase (NDP forming)